MNETDYLLTCAQEECSELAQRLSKCERFGLTEVQPGKEALGNNERRAIEEIWDLLTVLTVLRIMPKATPLSNRIPIGPFVRKVDKLRKFAEYSRSLGILDGPTPLLDDCGVSRSSQPHKVTSGGTAEDQKYWGKRIELKPMAPCYPLGQPRTPFETLASQHADRLEQTILEIGMLVKGKEAGFEEKVAGLVAAAVGGEATMGDLQRIADGGE